MDTAHAHARSITVKADAWPRFADSSFVVKAEANYPPVTLKFNILETCLNTDQLKYPSTKNKDLLSLS